MHGTFKSLIATFLLLTLASCAGSKRYNIDTWVRMTERSDRQQQAVQLKRELAEVVPEAGKGWAFSGRVFSWSPQSEAPQFRYGGSSWDLREVASLRRGGIMEVTVQFDMRPGVPVYRVILEPIDFPASAMDAWAGYVMLDTGLNRDDDSDEQLYAPLEDAQRTEDGRLVTDWVYCGHCVADGPVQGDDAQHIRLQDYARSFGASDPHAAWLEPWSYRLLAIRANGPALATGAAAFARAREIAQAGSNALARRRARAEQNAAYARFFRDVHDPLSFEAFAARSDCPGDYRGFAPVGNIAESHADDAREAERYARCQGALVERYDFEEYVRRHPQLVAREAALWARTSGIDRRAVLGPQDQLDLAMARIERAWASAEKSWARAERIAANDAQRQRQQAIDRSIFVQTQASISAWQREVAGMAPVVRADGTISTANAERERALRAARTNALRAEAERTEDRTEASSAATSPGGARRSAAAEAPTTGAGSRSYEGFERVAEVRAHDLPCADIPTPEEVLELEQGLPVPGFDAAWERCLRASEGGASRAAAPAPSRVGEDANPSQIASTRAPGSVGSEGPDAGATDAVGHGSPGTAPSKPFADFRSEVEVPATPPRGPRFMFVGDLPFEHRGHAFSTRDQAIEGLEGTWARTALSEHCRKALDGADGHQGVRTVESVQLEQVASTRWIGSARLDGYCRLLPGDDAYSALPACPREAAGQTGCHVRDRY